MPAKLPPPPPPPVQPVPDTSTALTRAKEANDALEATMRRAESFTEEERNRRVDDEWSTVESLRHIVLIIDVWLSRTIGGEQDPFHPMALPPHFMPPKLPGTSIDPDARPTFDEACAVVRGRLAALNSYVEALTPEELARPIEGHAGSVGGALDVIFSELHAHNYFINRDLDHIEKAR